MNPSIARFLVLGAVLAATFTPSRMSAMTNVFDQNSGATISSSFVESQNWVAAFGSLTPNSGSQFFESDNGNFASDFIGLHFAKQLGGTIQNTSYPVSFFVAANSLGVGLGAVPFSDFTELAIGGAAGTMQWLITPTPLPDQGWSKWSGMYTPSPADIGTPFQFRMTVNIKSRRSLALDGPMTALPEPSTASVAAICGFAAATLSKRRRRGINAGI